LEAKIINKYKSRNIKWLKAKATKVFNKFIRERDSDYRGFGVCISSGQPLKVPSVNSHCGHFYSAGHYPELAFNEDNAHLQGKSDNYFKSGNLLEYRKNLIKKIGIERVERLDFIADQSKRNFYKVDRFFLIDIIEKYK